MGQKHYKKWIPAFRIAHFLILFLLKTHSTELFWQKFVRQTFFFFGLTMAYYFSASCVICGSSVNNCLFQLQDLVFKKIWHNCYVLWLIIFVQKTSEDKHELPIRYKVWLREGGSGGGALNFFLVGMFGTEHRNGGGG